MPGIFFATILWVAIPAAVVERPGIFASLGRSSDLTTGSRWRIFGLAVVIYVPMFVVIALLTPWSKVAGSVSLSRPCSTGSSRCSPPWPRR